MQTMIVKSVPELTDGEYLACYRLNHRHNGQMMYTLSEHRKQPKDRSRAIMVWEDDVLVGWGLMFRGKSSSYDYSTHRWTHSDKLGAWTLHSYVRRTHRRKGIGTAIVKEAFKRRRKAKVGVFDTDSGGKQIYASFVDAGVAAWE